MQNAVRTWNINTWINYKDKWFQQKFMMTDSKIFEIFSFLKRRSEDSSGGTLYHCSHPGNGK